MSDIRLNQVSSRDDENHDDKARKAVTTLLGLKFNAEELADNAVQYLTDFGRYTIPREYPMAVSCEFHGLAVNLPRFTVPPGGSLVAQVLKNGAPVSSLTVAYSPGQTGIRRVKGRTAYAAGDTFDLQVTTSNLGSEVELSATIGVRSTKED